MKPYTIIIIIILALVTIYQIYLRYNIRHNNSDGGYVTISELPELIKALNASKTNGSFFVLLIPNTAESDGYNANLQYSIEDNEIGIDWVLIAKSNINNKDKFEEIIKNKGLNCKHLSGNNVDYIRATGNKNMEEIGKSLLQEMFSVTAETKFQLIITGMTWRNKSY